MTSLMYISHYNYLFLRKLSENYQLNSINIKLQTPLGDVHTSNKIFKGENVEDEMQMQNDI